jgi:hypothetical protein
MPSAYEKSSVAKNVREAEDKHIRSEQDKIANKKQVEKIEELTYEQVQHRAEDLQERTKQLEVATNASVSEYALKIAANLTAEGREDLQNATRNFAQEAADLAASAAFRIKIAMGKVSDDDFVRLATEYARDPYEQVITFKNEKGAHVTIDLTKLEDLQDNLRTTNDLVSKKMEEWESARQSRTQAVADSRKHEKNVKALTGDTDYAALKIVELARIVAQGDEEERSKAEQTLSAIKDAFNNRQYGKELARSVDVVNASDRYAQEKQYRAITEIIDNTVAQEKSKIASRERWYAENSQEIGKNISKIKTSEEKYNYVELEIARAQTSLNIENLDPEKLVKQIQTEWLEKNNQEIQKTLLQNLNIKDPINSYEDKIRENISDVRHELGLNSVEIYIPNSDKNIYVEPTRILETVKESWWQSQEQQIIQYVLGQKNAKGRETAIQDVIAKAKLFGVELPRENLIKILGNSWVESLEDTIGSKLDQIVRIQDADKQKEEFTKLVGASTDTLLSINPEANPTALATKIKSLVLRAHTSFIEEENIRIAELENKAKQKRIKGHQERISSLV